MEEQILYNLMLKMLNMKVFFSIVITSNFIF